MRIFNLFIFLVITFSGSSQKVDKDDPTYLYINNNNIADYVDWPVDLEKRTAFFDTISNPSILRETIPLKVKSGQYDVSWLKDQVIFYLDTSKDVFYGNPSIFKKLSKASGVFNEEGRQFVAEMTQKYWPKNQKQYEELAYVLMQFGVLKLYAHLYAEVITIDSEQKEDGWHVSYKCLWHYCTNDCYDPVYKFEITFLEGERKVFFEVK